ncbi:MAG: HPr(Ser) kinase/phosphatase [Erysipelotrichaceae bacterium]|nr:HPr(Ser) kinase/phosphatase [Erysipelotrichaceae bacterium]
MSDFVSVRELAYASNLELLAGEAGLDAKIAEDMISRPGLEFTGFFDYFDSKRVVLVGSKDNSFFKTLSKEKQRENVEKIFMLHPPCLVFSKNVEVDKLFYEMAEKYNICIFKSNLKTTPTSSKLYTFLQDKLAPKISAHGTLIDINGMGTLIIGKSGIGKSETALDLIKRGHQLIADDLVEIIEKEPGNLVGSAPEILRRYMEIRGIGIVDVVTMFGAGAYRQKKNIKLVVELEAWNTDKYYDRLGLESQKIKYFNTEITKITIPVLPGRTVALLVESAAMNEKLKLMGHFAAQDFITKVNDKASRGEE